MSDLNLEMGVVRTTGKGNKQRLVPVGKEAVNAAREYLQSGRAALLKGRASRYLFVTARGGCLTRQGFWKLLAGYGRKAGLFSGITPHVLRHSFASLAADLGYNEPTIAALLGHTTHSSTSRYVHSADAVLLAAADAVANETLKLMGDGNQLIASSQ